MKKRTLRFMLSLCMLTVLFAGVSAANAEGTKDLAANGGYRPYTERYSDNASGQQHLSVMHVCLKAGETVCFGTSVSDAKLYNTSGGTNSGYLFSNSAMGKDYTDAQLAYVNTADIYVVNDDYANIAAAIAAGKTPGNDGVTLIDLPASAGKTTPGYICDRAQEAGGADISDSGTGYKVTASNTVHGYDSGYVAGVKTSANTFTAASDGIYTVVFFSSSHTNEGPTMVSYDDTTPFAQTQGGGCIASWDISVYNSGVLQTGRVYTNELYLNLGGNAITNGVSTGALKSQMYAVTDDGYQYKVDFNGLDPSALDFTANPFGLTKADGSSLLHSVRSSTDTLSDLSDHGITVSSAGNYKLFFETPSAGALSALSIGDPQAASASGITAFKFKGTGDSTENQGYAGSGGTFSFTADSTVAATSYQIELDFSSINGGKVVLSNAITNGATNSIVWDGRDANGKVVPAGTYSQVTLTLKKGEVHFPLGDVEQNPNGIKVTRLNGTSPDSTVYYNNSASNAGTSIYPWTAANWTVGDEADATAGVDSTNGAMAFTNKHTTDASLLGDGDKCALDVWAIGSSVSAGNYSFSLVNSTCSVTFDVQDHGVTPADQTVSYGKTATEPADLTETGYTFGGWYKDAACTTANAFDFATPITTDTTLYAKWTIITYTVKFAAETGGTLGGTANDQSVAYGSKASNVCTEAVTSSDYTFLGWSYDYAGADGQTHTGVAADYSTVPVYGDVTFTATYAKKPYVSVTATNGYVNITSGTKPSTTAPDSIKASVDSSKTPLTLPTQIAMCYIPVNSNYELDSINVTDLAGNTKSLTDGSNTFTPAGATSDVTITVSHANKTIIATNVNDSLRFSVTFAPIQTSYTVEHFQQNTGDGYTLDYTDNYSDIDIGTKADYTPKTYAGFTYDATKTTWEAKNIAASSTALSVQPDGSLVIKLYYTRNQYTLSFDANGHDNAPDAQTVSYGAKASQPAAQTLAGYTFGGWYENAVCTGTAADLSGWTMPDHGVTLYAKWIENTAEITYASADDKMGSVSVASESVASVCGSAAGSTATAKSGYHFVCWTDKNGSVVSTNAGLVPARNADGIYESAAYTANFAVTPVSAGSSASSGTVTVPVTGDTTVNVTASVSGDTAAVAVTDSELQKALGSGESVTVDASSLKTDAAEIPASAVKTVAAVSDASLTVKTGSGAVTLDSATLAQTAALGGSVTVSVQKADSSSLTDAQKALVGDRPVYDLKLTAGTKTVSSFDGSVTVSVPYTLKAGEQADAVTVWFLSDSGTLTPVSGVYDAKTGTVSFKTTHFSAYVVGYFPFTDVPDSHWAYSDVAWAYTNGLLSGVSETTFAPEQTMTRAMLVTVLWRAAGSPTVDYAMNFSDVPEGEWYSEAVRWTASEKLVNGFSDGSFRLDETVTREQLAAILYRSEQRSGGGFTGDWAFRLDYSDAGSVSDWAYESMCWCTMKGIVTGSDGALQPQSGATRAQAAAMLRRYAAVKKA